MSKSLNNRKSNQFIVQGGILAAVGILVRIIGMFKRIPLTNIIGDRGNGLYAAAYEIYSIVLLISSYSLPLAISKMVSARLATKQYINIDKVFKIAICFAIISGGAAAFVVYFAADLLAGMMLEPMSALALRVLAPTLLVVAVMGVIRGYFQGLGTMIPTAISQLVEQIFVVSGSLIGALALFKYGEKVGDLLNEENYSAAYGAAGGSIGPLVGSIAGLSFLVFICVIFRNHQLKKIRADRISKDETLGKIIVMMVMIIIPVILSTVIYNITNIIDQRIYNQVMIDKGFESIKTIHWGIYTGKYNVLKNIPLAIASALCASTVPAISKGIARGNIEDVLHKIKNVIKSTMFISIPCASAFIVLSRDIMSLLFNDSSDMPAWMLSIGAISVVFYSLSTLTNGILQGVNKVFTPVINAVISLVIHLAVLYPLLQFTDAGVYSVVIANIVFGLSMCILNSFALRRSIEYKQEFKKTLLLPTAGATVMGIVLFMLKSIINMLAFEGKLAQVIIFIILVLIGCIVYFATLLMLRGVDEDMLLIIPGGKYLLRFYR